MTSLISPLNERLPHLTARRVVIITTTGLCPDSALQCALTELGDDRVLFSVDYPYEDATEVRRKATTRLQMDPRPPRVR